MTTPALAVPVKGRGRHYEHPTTGDLVPSVTNIIDLLDKPALPRWAARTVAEQAVAMRDSLTKLDEAEAIDLLKGAPWRKSNRAADRGTSIHAYVEALLTGQPAPTLEGEALEFKAAADAYLAAVGLTAEAVEYTEVTFFNATYAGTADCVAVIDGERWLLDWKTSSGLYPEVALQLSALAACGTLWTAAVGLQQAPSFDRLGAVRFGRDGTWEMKEVEDREACADAFFALRTAWEWKVGPKPLTKVSLTREQD